MVRALVPSLGLILLAFQALPAAAGVNHGAAVAVACSFNPATATADGCAGAQATGSVQHTDFYTGHTGTNYGANRPPWNAAGVEYPVGYAGSLLDGSVGANLPGCASVNATGGTTGGPLVTIGSVPCTLSGLDFSGHNGVCVYISAGLTGAVTFSNDKFLSGPNCNPPGGGPLYALNTGSNLTFLIEWCEFDNTNIGNSNPGSYILAYLTGGSMEVKYSAFLNCPSSCIQNNAPSGTETFLYHWNYMERMGADAGTTHANWEIDNSTSSTATITDSYNTLYQTSADCCGTTLLYPTNRTGATIANYQADHNTLVSKGTVPPSTVAYLIEPNGESEPSGITNMDLTDNFLDDSGSFGYIYSPGSGFTIPGSCRRNKDLVSGAFITSPPTYGGPSNISCQST